MSVFFNLFSYYPLLLVSLILPDNDFFFHIPFIDPHTNFETVTETQFHYKFHFGFSITFFPIMLFFHTPFTDPHANFKTVTESQLHHKSC